MEHDESLHPIALSVPNPSRPGRARPPAPPPHAHHWQQRLLALWQAKGAISTALLPLSWLYGAVLRLRRWCYTRLPPAVPTPRPPIIVVGNLVVGGTGKTPVVIALAVELSQLGWRPGIISRGYGVRIGAAARTGCGELDAARFGDEPALIARQTRCPIAVHPKRLRALQALLAQYPEVDCVIADDGLQHLALPRDVTVIVQDARGVGNGRLLPAGPLREPARRLADAQVLMSNVMARNVVEARVAKAAQEQAMQQYVPTLPGYHAVMWLAPVSVTRLADGLNMDWQDWCEQHREKKVAALAGIGQPERFFAMLREHGQALSHTRALADHAALNAAKLQGLDDAHAILITDKDAIKLAQDIDQRLWSVQVSGHYPDVHAINDDAIGPIFSFKWVDLISERLLQYRDRSAVH